MDSSLSARLNTVPMAEFSLKWRFTDPKYDVLLPIHLEQIQPLDAPSSELIWNFILDSNFLVLKISTDDLFKPGFFRHYETTLIPGNPDEDSRIRKWLYRCALPFDQEIFLSWEPKCAIKTTWKMLVKHWSSFYYPGSDDLVVIDRSLDWCVLFFHELELHFGTNRPRVPRGKGDEPEPPITRVLKS